MKRDSRLSRVLHVLLHMAERSGPQTSETLSRAMNTNPVVVRRIMAGLRDRGFVRSEKGHGGGWSIVCKFEEVTLRDIYDSLGQPEILAMGNRTDAPGCLIEQAVNSVLGEAFGEAEALLLHRFGEVTLAQLRTDFRTRLTERGGSNTLENLHGV